MPVKLGDKKTIYDFYELEVIHLDENYEQNTLFHTRITIGNLKIVLVVSDDHWENPERMIFELLGAIEDHQNHCLSILNMDKFPIHSHPLGPPICVIQIGKHNLTIHSPALKDKDFVSSELIHLAGKIKSEGVY